MNCKLITGVVEHTPEPDTSESYTRYEMPVRVTGRKEPVIVEMYGMRDIITRYPKGAKINIQVQKKTRPVFERALYGLRKRYDSFYTAVVVP